MASGERQELRQGRESAGRQDIGAERGKGFGAARQDARAKAEVANCALQEGGLALVAVDEGDPGTGLKLVCQNGDDYAWEAAAAAQVCPMGPARGGEGEKLGGVADVAAFNLGDGGFGDQVDMGRPARDECGKAGQSVCCFT